MKIRRLVSLMMALILAIALAVPASALVNLTLCLGYFLVLRRRDATSLKKALDNPIST